MGTLVLNEVEARLLGVLIEKELTTPDQYPLSTKALRAGSNQKSNRHPAVSFVEAEVYVGAQGLEAKGLASRVPPGMGARVERYEHQARQTLSLDRVQLAVMAELLLRGPQQPGELRTRASRMGSMDTLAELAHVLESLIKRNLVRRLAPSPGSRAERYRELLSSPAAGIGQPVERAAELARPATPEEIVRRHDEQIEARAAGPVTAPTPSAAEPDRMLELERRIETLESRLNSLCEKLGEGA